MAKQIEITIDRMEAKGVSGLDAQNKRWTCKGATIGDTVLIRKKRKSKGSLLQITTESPQRIEGKCPHFLVCGGCQFQHTPLSVQRSAKEDMVRRLFPNFEGAFHPIQGASNGYQYRNKMELSFGRRRFYSSPPAEKPEDGSYLGMHPWGWYSKIVPLKQCSLADPLIDQAIRLLSDLDLSPAWDTYNHCGVWRHIVFREGNGLLVNLITSSEAQRDDLLMVSEKLQQIPGIRGILWTVNDGVAEVAIGELREILFGRADIEIPLLGRSLLLPYDGFAQVNHQGAAILLQQIRDACTEKRGTLLDLYCGSGAIGIALSDHFDRIIGIEVQEKAIEQARLNALRNNVEGEWHVGPVEKVLPTLNWDDPSTIIVDPPREGLHPSVAKFLATQEADQLIYVACNPKSLARDQKILEEGIWILEQIWTVDLFPQTPHVETVGRFIRRSEDS